MIKTLYKYLITEFLKYFLITVSIFSFLYIAIDFIAKIDNLLEKGVGGKIIFQFFSYNIPQVVSQVSPIATAVSCSILFSLMARRNELVALRGSGISPNSIKLPILVFAILFSWLNFMLNEFIIPRASGVSQRIWDTYVKHQDMSKGYIRDRIWYRAGSILIYCDRFDGASNTMIRPFILYMNKDFRPEKRVSAKRGLWVGGKWVLEDTFEQINEDNLIKTREAGILVLDLPLRPEDLYSNVERPQWMSVFALKSMADKISREGYDATLYLVNMHMKIGFPAIHFLLALAITSLPLWRRGPSIGISIAITILVCFAYLVLVGAMRTISLAGLIHPFYSIWIPNAVFLMVGYYLSRLEEYL